MLKKKPREVISYLVSDPINNRIHFLCFLTFHISLQMKICTFNHCACVWGKTCLHAMLIEHRELLSFSFASVRLRELLTFRFASIRHRELLSFSFASIRHRALLSFSFASIKQVLCRIRSFSLFPFFFFLFLAPVSPLGCVSQKW